MDLRAVGFHRAGPAGVLRGVLRQTLLLGVVGVVLGVLLARAAVPALSSLMPGIELVRQAVVGVPREAFVRYPR